MRGAQLFLVRGGSLFKLVLTIALLCGATTLASAAQTLTTLYSFCAQQNCADGLNPNAPPLQARDGNFYGTTEWGGLSGAPCNNGTSGCGTVFKVTPSGSFTVLYSFCAQPNCSDGAIPYDSLIQATDGNFYGTTIIGGAHSQGTVFRITPTGVLTTLYSFCSQSNCADGALPAAGLVQAWDGTLYGTTEAGGRHNFECNQLGCGTIFAISPSGTFHTVYNFCSQAGCVDGIAPLAALIQGADGNFYGTTSEGGANGPTYGTVFKITPSGTLTTLYSFCAERFCPDGLTPLSPVVQATDGSIYGTTGAGGPNGVFCCGTVFKIDPSGLLTTIYGFCSLPQCADGQSPTGALLQAGDGNFYGTTGSGGTGRGTLFKITPVGVLTTLYRFCSFDPLRDCLDGETPTGLAQGNNGNFYGTTSGGGIHNFQGGYGGTVFSFTGPTPVPTQFVPLAPCRVADTRGGQPIQGGTSQDFIIPGLGNCGVPTAATAYSLNVTVVPQQQLHYLTLWPTGTAEPNVSLLNSPDGRVKANAAIVSAGAGGAVSVYASDTTNVILDIDGYFAAPGSQTLQFYPLTPCRVIDTRGTNGDLGGPYLHAQVERDFPVLESSCLTGVQGAQAYSMNLTVVPHPAGQELGYLTVWPAGEAQPTVSTLNNPTATVVANAAIVPAGTNGGIAVYPYNTTDLIADINGYFAVPGSGGYSFYPVAPCRAYDSRNNNGQPFSGERTVNIAASPCAPPETAAGYVLNATVVPSPTLGYLTLWADGQTMPGVSTLNAYDGSITSNLAIVPNSDGSTDAFAGDGTTQLILDISGYFGP